MLVAMGMIGFGLFVGVGIEDTNTKIIEVLMEMTNAMHNCGRCGMEGILKLTKGFYFWHH